MRQLAKAKRNPALELSKEKTSITSAMERFDFLGFENGYLDQTELIRTPSQKSFNRMITRLSTQEHIKGPFLGTPEEIPELKYGYAWFSLDNKDLDLEWDLGQMPGTTTEKDTYNQFLGAWSSYFLFTKEQWYQYCYSITLLAVWTIIEWLLTCNCNLYPSIPRRNIWQDDLKSRLK